jgi:hypothetical protein
MGTNYYPGVNPVNSDQIAANASGINVGGNLPYSVDDFLSIYPQFGSIASTGDPIIPLIVLQLYIDLALESIQLNRFRASWKLVVGLFIAHFCTLWLKSFATPEDGVDVIAKAGETTGIIVSESVDGVSYSMDTSFISTDLQGFAGWKTTAFGIQLATFARLYGKGGMVVR